ncbi:MAG: S41 family peptidase [Alphaproteobacteria bacterium]|nr:S41 family peptidase [Alphaproteobacteria bacterium]
MNKGSYACLGRVAASLSAALFVSSCACAGHGTPSPLSPKDSALFYAHVADKVRRDYVEPVDNTKLLEGALNGMLSSLDRYSTYLPPKKYQEIRKQAHGEYGGVGLEIAYEEGALRVVSAIEDTPAQKAGITSGDLITAIDAKPVYEMSLYEAGEHLRGEPHSHVTLSIRRRQEPPFDIRLKRERIRVASVKGELKGNVGYMRLTTFNEHTTDNLQELITSLKQRAGKNLAGFVLDVRNNPGGLFDQAVSVCELFLDKGEIVSIRGRDPKKDLSFFAQGQDETEGAPLVVLINEGSASASEIVAGALQDHKRAVIVGVKSFGKASVQSVIPMTNGAAIKMTTAYYYTPSGKSIQKTGIIPDIKIEQSAPAKADVAQPTKQKTEKTKKERTSTPEDEKVRDLQLEQAINMIQALRLNKASAAEKKSA